MSFEISRETAFHIFKFIYRLLMLLSVAAILIVGAVIGSDEPFINEKAGAAVVYSVSTVFTIEMIARLLPIKLFESIGTVKHYKRYYSPRKTETPTDRKIFYKRSFREIAPVAVFWVLLNGIFVILLKLSLIGESVMILLSLIFGVGDLVCVLFVCPFKLMMKNRCCSSCRIYNWDMLFLVTPLIFTRNAAFILPISLAFVIFLLWEVSFYLHPERFYPEGNGRLLCAECREKQCLHHKRFFAFLRNLTKVERKH